VTVVNENSEAGDVWTTFDAALETPNKAAATVTAHAPSSHVDRVSPLSEPSGVSSAPVGSAASRPRPPQRVPRSNRSTGRNPWPPEAVTVLKDWLFKVRQNFGERPVY
jgi:hypothetical protein